MFELLSNIHNFFGIPEHLIGMMTFLPDSVKEALVAVIVFVPWLYFLYYAIELLERYFMKNLGKFLNLLKNFGPLFAALVSSVPESGYSVLASVLYSRKMITRGILLAFYIACCDESLPLLFMNISKAPVIVPIIILKLIIGVLVAFTVDLVYVKDTQTDKADQLNTIVNVEGCCAHRITTDENPPYWWAHPLNHMFNMLIFSAVILIVINLAVDYFGGAEALSKVLMIDSPLQVILCAIIGLIPNSVFSIFFGLAYVKGIISFPALLAGLISATGLGLATLKKYHKDVSDYNLICGILFGVAIAAGLFIYYNMVFIQIFKTAVG